MVSLNSERQFFSVLDEAALSLSNILSNHFQAAYDETYSIVTYDCNIGELIF